MINKLCFNIGKIILNQEVDLEKHQADNNQLKEKLNIEVTERVGFIHFALK